MSDKKGKMDQAAKARIMSSEYKKNDGKATDWSKRAQKPADKNYPQHTNELGFICGVILLEQYLVCSLHGKLTQY